MQIIEFSNLNEILIHEDISLTIGAFDGIHLGHQSLINELEKKIFKKALMTFNPTPKAYFSKQFTYITPIDKKIKLLENKIDYLLIINFNEYFANSRKEEFVQFLKNNRVRDIICGHDFHFGYKGEGSIKDLTIFNLTVISPVLIDNCRVSSTSIKKALHDGDLKTANLYLGRPYSIKGKVIHGSALGRTIGFPTANIDASEYELLKNGVYITKTLYDGKLYMSMTNIGQNPTINFQKDIRIETYILDLNANLYDKEIEVFFIEKMRDEKKFSSKEELIKELINNVMEVRNYYET